ncbi:hypothetical protein LCGC14_2201400, partial [marine sediment metagenome]
AWELIRELRKTKTLVTVNTELRTYTDFLIISDSVTRDARTGRVLDITVRLREFRKATVETVEAPEPESEVDKPTPDLGPKQTRPAPTSVEAKSSSTLADAANALGDLLSGGG